MIGIIELLSAFVWWIGLAAILTAVAAVIGVVWVSTTDWLRDRRMTAELEDLIDRETRGVA